MLTIVLKIAELQEINEYKRQCISSQITRQEIIHIADSNQFGIEVLIDTYSFILAKASPSPIVFHVLVFFHLSAFIFMMSDVPNWEFGLVLGSQYYKLNLIDIGCEISMRDQLRFIYQTMESPENQLMGSGRTTLVDVLSFCLWNCQFSLYVSKKKKSRFQWFIELPKFVIRRKSNLNSNKILKRGYLSKLIDDTHSILNEVQFFYFSFTNTY